MACLVLALLGRVLGLFALRYLDSNGLDIPDVASHGRFAILVETDGAHLVLGASSHPYRTALRLSADPCIYTVEHQHRAVGTFDLCARVLRYTLNGRVFEIAHTGRGYLMESRPQSAGAISRGLVPGKENGIARLAEGYRINVFVFNDAQRTSYLNKNINRETEELFGMVDQIYRESKAGIKINLAGILNMRDDVEMGPDVLGDFKALVEPMRYDPQNLDTPLSASDLVIFLTASRSPAGEGKVYHGMSYFGGSNGLNKSYSVVFTGQADPRYFVAKKIAHEIAHSLGVHHDEDKGFLMESSTCSSCENEKRLMSKSSVDQMNRFIKAYESIFEVRPPADDSDQEPITSSNSAYSYIKKRRRHSFSDIVSKRLNGKTPETTSFTYYLAISLVFYLMSIFVAIYYLK